MNNSYQNKHSRTLVEPFKIVGDWNCQLKKLQEMFPQLTNADLHFQTGKEELLLARVMNRLNKERIEVIEIIRKGQVKRVI
ncbi:hypothetical protein QNI19_11025 [Cytophagaceae bacterium DM2B3-1]|uniref:General stress protein CsbD n=1 Tax=Xanthocytophaga flava TaxID=3048013 RepID=A0ABT7CIE0_9BACT|nr:hypothetical protein [Xanthocytophaga flavus]MDJ1469519.1 hypothetical protein [Xanthocytophaga flavus]MDJ1493465.1 hypothetical protein [Xanthocytophaga flavus]